MHAAIFWGSLFLVFYAFFGYPISLILIARFRARRDAKEPFFPTVSFIITVCNEEVLIREKIENTLDLDYPAEKLQVLVVCDGSTDETQRIAGEYAPKGIELLATPMPAGKENARMLGAQRARGEVLVFSDADCRLEPGSLERIVSHFVDPAVGCAGTAGCMIAGGQCLLGAGAYVRYERWLQRLEARIASLVGLNGTFFAARKEVCEAFSEEMQGDFRVLVNSMRMGLKGIVDPAAANYRLALADVEWEIGRKANHVLHGLTVLFQNLEYLNPLRYGFFSYLYFCQKPLRWLAPFFLAFAFAANLILAFSSPGYAILLLLQCIFYTAAFWGLQHMSPPEHTLLKIPAKFVAVNIAMMLAWWQYFRGQRQVVWTASER